MNPTTKTQGRDGQLVLAGPVARGCEIIARRWTPQLLVILMEGPARFVELASAVPGLSGRVMTERLKELQDAGLVQRIVDPGPPITSTYLLTDEGELLRPALAALSRWAESWGQARSAS
jgi:DNA-binding HxlR family transcriptional regulator